MPYPRLSMRSARAAVVFGAIATGAITPAFATDVALVTSSAQVGYGQWQRFDVSDLDAVSGGTEWIDDSNTLAAGFGSPLTFSFTIGAGQVGQLTVVDAGFAGDTFLLFNAGVALAPTSAVALTSFDTAPSVGDDFEAALANASFSRAVLTLGAGSYQVSGRLDQSVQAGGLPLNSTSGGVQLTVSAVPEPATGLAMLAGLGLMGLRMRNRALHAR